MRLNRPLPWPSIDAVRLGDGSPGSVADRHSAKMSLDGPDRAVGNQRPCCEQDRVFVVSTLRTSLAPLQGQVPTWWIRESFGVFDVGPESPADRAGVGLAVVRWPYRCSARRLGMCEEKRFSQRFGLVVRLKSYGGQNADGESPSTQGVGRVPPDG